MKSSGFFLQRQVMRLTAAVTTPCGAEEWRVRAPGRAELETVCCRGAEETWEDGGARQGHGGGSEAQGPRPVTTWVPGGPRHLRAGQREGRDMEGLGMLRVVTEVSISVLAGQVTDIGRTSGCWKEASF